ncbi:PREDICTED: uncharacterized protein LOC109161160 isoform X2 [Ipomoea nil]|uniref:uncharacterized protein LOC109161160 isoform X2 n=1 Tax=Ipomoea nil TaxID=35883 RepID=UPI000900DC46|nr:PREDICTED: uncharacterized protein LOC109161160 isoform X2 [Ipomoea nil]
MVAEKSMAMGSGRSKPPLHNFTLPYGLKWGNQKFLRCGKLDSDGEIAAIHRRRGSDERVGNFRRADVENGIAAVRKKLMNDLQAETDKMKDAILRTGLEEEEEEVPPPPPQAAAAAVEEDNINNEHSPPPPTTVPPPESAGAADPNKPWSLRTRRSACKPPNGFPAEAGGGSSQAFKVDVMRPENNKSPLPILRSGFAAAAAPPTGGEKRERAKFSVPLARREIEEDFMAIIGHRPARRPKKRAKLVQKSLDTLFPGLWLTEITADLYKVPDDQ